MTDDQIEKSRQLSRSRLGRIRLQRSGEKVHAFFGLGHEAIEQRHIHAMQILQRVQNSKLRTQIEMKRCVPDGSEIQQGNVPVRLLECQGSIDGRSSTPGSAFGAQECENLGSPNTA